MRQPVHHSTPGYRAATLVLCLTVALVMGTWRTTSATFSASIASTSTNDLGSQIRAAQEKCRGSVPRAATRYSSQQLRQWTRGISPIVVRPSPWNSPTSTFKYRRPPWVIGLTNSYAGNAARQQVYAGFHHMIAAYKKIGLVRKSVEYLSNLNVTTHLAQIRQLVHQHVNAIMDIGESPTAFSPVIKEAYAAGIPFVTMDAPVTSPYAVNVTTNNYLQAVDWTGWMIRNLGGHGSVVMIEGIPGEPGSEIWQKAGQCMFNQFSSIKVVANVAGYWTESKAKTAMLQALATHPQTIDAVWIQGPGSVGMIQAYLQTGRPLPKIFTSFGDQATLAYWHAHPNLHVYIAPQPPQDSTVEAFRVIIRMLEGQRPILNTIYNVGPPVTSPQTLWKPSYQWPSSQAFGEFPEYKWMSDSTLNKYFSNGHAERPRGPAVTYVPYG